MDSFTDAIRAMSVSTLHEARSLLMQVTLRWAGQITATATTITFFNSMLDPYMDEIAQSVVSHQYVRDEFYVDDGMADQYTFLRAPRNTDPETEPAEDS